MIRSRIVNRGFQAFYSTARTMSAQDIKHNIEFVNEQIAQKHPMQRVTLVAVSKTKSEADIMAAYEQGHRDFGESYVQELVGKVDNLPRDIRWHFIGHLQSNKAKLITDITNLHLFHTIHNAKLATQMNKLCVTRPTLLKVMAQINTSREPNKNGVIPEDCTELVQHIITNCPLLEFSGLMTIGDYESSSANHSVDNPNPDFKTLVECKEKVCKDLNLNPDKVTLSMGMSSDYEHAVEMGSTYVRVGSTIFGPRNYPPGKGPQKKAE